MKRTIIIALALVALSLLFAQENPIADYMKSPNLKSFRFAVDHIAEKEKNGSDNMQMQLTLAFITNQESKRIMALAEERFEKLSAGERFALGNLYLSMDKYPEAIKIYDRINQDSPKWSCPWRHKGEALYKNKDFKAAVFALEQSVETNKEHYDAYLWLAFAQYETKQYKAARKSLETAFSLSAVEEGSHFDEELPEEKVMELYEKIKKKTK